MTDNRAKNLVAELRNMGVNAALAGDDLVVYPKPGNRQCGGCTLCCKLMPVKEIDKKSNTRCPHQRQHHGCAIYKDRPMSCKLWNCSWLINKDMADQQRPDRAHVVISPGLETFWFRNNDTGEQIPVSAIEIWVDPKYPDAYKDKRILAFLERRGKDGIAALVRYSSSDAFVIFSPAMTGGGWIEERGGTVIPEAESNALRLAEMRKRDLSLIDKTCTE